MTYSPGKTFVRKATVATAILDIEFTETPQEFTGLEGYDRALLLFRFQGFPSGENLSIGYEWMN